MPAAQTPAVKPPAPAAPQDAGRPGGWIVQLMALKDRDRGADARAAPGGEGLSRVRRWIRRRARPIIYRVQVGGYPDRDKADQVARRLEKEEQFKPYVRSR